MSTMAFAFAASSTVACAATGARQFTLSRAQITSARSRAFGGSTVVQRAGQNEASSRGKGGRGENRIVTMALPIDTYWITAVEAVSVAVLMAGVAVVAGIMINIKIEIEAFEEFKELEAKGLLPDEIIVPDEDFDLESPLFIFQNKELSSSKTNRNRPVREELQPELETDLKTELGKE